MIKNESKNKILSKSVKQTVLTVLFHLKDYKVFIISSFSFYIYLLRCNNIFCFVIWKSNKKTAFLLNFSHKKLA